MTHEEHKELAKKISKLSSRPVASFWMFAYSKALMPESRAVLFMMAAHDQFLESLRNRNIEARFKEMEESDLRKSLTQKAERIIEQWYKQHGKSIESIDKLLIYLYNLIA